MKAIMITFGIAAAATAATAQAQGIDRLLERNAMQQARIARDLVDGRVDTHNAALLEHRASDVYQLEAQCLAASPANAADLARLRQAQNDLAGATAWAEKHRTRRSEPALDRMRLRVAATRDVEQQKLIARGFKIGRLTLAQVADLEAAQSRIAQSEYGAQRRGHETLAAAETIQHQQNVQDYAILIDPSLAQPDAQRT